jgi:NAD(P)-dependent dehydrogenase (short-subunit alcohol dehydrogenase family)
VFAADQLPSPGLFQSGVSQPWSRPFSRGVIATVLAAGPRATLHDVAAESERRLEIETLDISQPEEIAAVRRRLAGRRLDLLFVSAGVAHGAAETVDSVYTDEFVDRDGDQLAGAHAGNRGVRSYAARQSHRFLGRFRRSPGSRSGRPSHS